MDLMKIGWEGVDWMHLAQDGNWWQSLVKTVINRRIPQKEDLDLYILLSQIGTDSI